MKNYIGTFWVVHDEESVVFATAFYRGLASGLSLGEALLEARQEVIRQRGWQGLTWASYMLYGDPAFMLLPTVQESLRASVFPAEKPAQKEQASSAPETLAPPEPRQSRTRAWLPRDWSIRRLALITGIAIGALVPIRFFLPWSLEQQPPHPSQQIHQPKAVGVMPFRALRIDPHLEWMREAIRDNFNSQLSSAADLKVYSKEYIDFLVQKGPATEIEVANQLGVAKMVSGSFLAVANTLRIEAHVVDVRSGVLEASDRVEGAQSEFFELQRQLALRIMARLNIPAPPEETGRASTPATAAPSLDAYKLLLEAEGETATAGPKKGEDPYSEGVLRKEADKLSGHSLQWMRTSRAWAQEAPQQQPASEEEIQQVLEMYRQAYEKKDLDLLENVYAALTPIQREANVKYFQNTRGITQRCGNKGQAVYLLG